MDIYINQDCIKYHIIHTAQDRILTRWKKSSFIIFNKKLYLKTFFPLANLMIKLIIV